MKNIKLATITILVPNRHANINPVNQIITKNGHLIIGRMGISVERQCLKGCTGLITLSIEGTKIEIENLTKKLNQLKNIRAKNIIISQP